MTDMTNLHTQLKERKRTSAPETNISYFYPKRDQNALKWDNSGTFSDQMSVHFGSESHNALKSGLKSIGFIPIGTNLISLWPNYDSTEEIAANDLYK